MIISNSKRIRLSIIYPSSIEIHYKPSGSISSSISIISNNAEYSLEVYITIISIRPTSGNQLVIGLISISRNNYNRRIFRNILFSQKQP